MLLLVDNFVGWVLPSNFMFISLLLFYFDFFHLLVVFLHKVSMSIICISNRFLSPYLASYKTGNSSPLGPSGIRKRLFWHSSPERWLSFWDAQCFLQAQPPPERLQGGGWKKSSKMCLGTLDSLFWLTISGISEDDYELMEFSAFRIPRWPQVVFEAFLFYNVCFSLEKEEDRVALVRGVAETWG